MKLLSLFLFCLSLGWATDPDYTIMLLPDTQYMVFTCSPGTLNQVMNWIVANRAANLGNNDQGTNVTLNLKAVIGLGDISQSATSGEYTRAWGNSTSGYGILAANSISFAGPGGNHDCTDPTTTHATTNCPGIATGGFFSADYQQAHGYFGSIGSGDVSAWGGSLDSANYYIKLNVGARRINILSVEYQPRAAALAWAKTIHDAYPSSEDIFVTHSLLSHALGLYGAFTNEATYTAATNDTASNNAGLVTSQVTSDDNFNSGVGMWNGYGGATFTALKAWNKLTLTLNGHWIAHEAQWTASPTGYNIQSKTNTSTSNRAQAVYNVFGNFQDMDAQDAAPSYSTWSHSGVGTTLGDVPAHTSTFCQASGASPSLAFRIGHIIILQFRPGAGVVEGYAVSAPTGLWEPSFANRANTAGSATPQRLFSLPYVGVPRSLPMTVGGISR